MRNPSGHADPRQAGASAPGNTRCSFTGTLEVSYGANGTFTAPRTFTGGVDCNNTVFGDPLHGTRKWCETRAVTPTPRPGWSFCAWEDTQCSFSGSLQVSYGANGTFTSPRTFTGGVACTNATFGDYLIPVNADAPDIDVVFVGEPDPLTPLGAKGVGEIGLVGIAAAIANGVHHATGRRIRSIPITLDRLL